MFRFCRVFKRSPTNATSTQKNKIQSYEALHDLHDLSLKATFTL